MQNLIHAQLISKPVPTDPLHDPLRNEIELCFLRMHRILDPFVNSGSSQIVSNNQFRRE